MRMLGCVLIAVVALLGLAPTSMAAGHSDGRPPPEAGVSLLAVSLTAGAAIAAVGRGAFQVLGHRRTAGHEAAGHEAAGHDVAGYTTAGLAPGTVTADAVTAHPAHRPPSRRSE